MRYAIRVPGLAVMALVLCGCATVDEGGSALGIPGAGQVPPWLAPTGGCVADELRRQSLVEFESHTCHPDLEHCYELCRGGNGSACQAAAWSLQTEGPTTRSPEISALFERACLLGIASGCTNHGADIVRRDWACAERLFEFSCSGDDPWGCTMLGSILVEMMGPHAPEIERASGLFDRACALASESHSACVRGRTIQNAMGVQGF